MNSSLPHPQSPGNKTPPTAIVVIGVSGCGKTTIGRGLSEQLGWPFYDADDFHPPSNIEKMANGIPLNDNDRQPWLNRLHELIDNHLSQDQSLVLACSALKEKYRQLLKGDLERVWFVHLQGDFDLIYNRMQKRAGHYMQAEMLRSQFADLEQPQDAYSISIDAPVQNILDQIINKLNLPIK